MTTARTSRNFARRWIGAAVIGLVTSVVVASAQAPAPAASVWDGVYTEAQASRAVGVFDASCARCHTLTADGQRPLSGDRFWRGYTQRTVGDLLTYVSTSMPNGNPGTLSASSYADLVALILKSNGLPAGTAELAAATAALVQIVPKGGAGELPDGSLVRVVGCLARNGSDWVLTSATAPERIDKVGVGPEDATRQLGERTFALKFVMTRLDAFKGHRMSASGLLMGEGGVNGVNVTTVNRVAESCP